MRTGDNSGRSAEWGSVLIELSLILILVFLIVFGAFSLCVSIRHDLNVAKVTRQMSKFVLRQCSSLVWAAGGGEAEASSGNSLAVLSSCISQAAENALAQGERVLPDMKLAVSVYVNENPPIPTRKVMAEFATTASTVSGAASRFDTAIISDRLQALLAHAGVVTIVEVFAPSPALAIPFKAAFLGREVIEYDAAVF